MKLNKLRKYHLLIQASRIEILKFHHQLNSLILYLIEYPPIQGERVKLSAR
jgi:hypothetical protein